MAHKKLKIAPIGDNFNERLVLVIAPTSAARCTASSVESRPALGQSFVSIGLLALFNFSRRAASDGELLELLLADPAPPSRTDCPRAQGRHRPNKPPPASAAAHHISGPPPDAIRPRRSRHAARTSALKPSLIHFCSLWLTSSCLQTME